MKSDKMKRILFHGQSCLFKNYNLPPLENPRWSRIKQRRSLTTLRESLFENPRWTLINQMGFFFAMQDRVPERVAVYHSQDLHHIHLNQTGSLSTSAQSCKNIDISNQLTRIGSWVRESHPRPRSQLQIWFRRWISIAFDLSSSWWFMQAASSLISNHQTYLQWGPYQTWSLQDQHTFSTHGLFWGSNSISICRVWNAVAPASKRSRFRILKASSRGHKHHKSAPISTASQDCALLSAMTNFSRFTRATRPDFRLFQTQNETKSILWGTSSQDTNFTSSFANIQNIGTFSQTIGSRSKNG